MDKKTPPRPMATNDELARFFGLGDDTRRELMRALGLPRRRKHAWSEVWMAIGLDPSQPRMVWKLITLGSDGENTLWNAQRVAMEIEVGAGTVNSWCRKKSFPEGFPPPLIDYRRKTRLWLPIDIHAYREPSIYGTAARQIRRRTGARKTMAPARKIEWHETLSPLPPTDG